MVLPKYMSICLLLISIYAANGFEDTIAKAVTPDRSIRKRSLNGFSIGDASFQTLPSGPWQTTGAKFTNGFGGSGGAGTVAWNPWSSYSSRLIAAAPSPSEVANAIAAAKQASANVLIAQQQMQAAKENVFNQQRLAMEKETAATILTQKSEAAAAIQRSEAAASAQSVVLAQQRLAHSKSAVSHQQRIAAARESEAASALQRSAHAAAAEIQKTEYEADKFGQYTRDGNAGAAHHLTLTKDAAFSGITAGTNHVPNLESLGPWTNGGLLGGLGATKSSSPTAWL